VNTSTVSSERHLDPINVSKKDAAALLGVCPRTIDNLIAAKELPCRRIGRRVPVPYTALVAFVRRDHLNSTEPEAGAEQEA
jgi:excisionase family DNA binding protein